MKNRIFKPQSKKGFSMDTPKEINSLEDLTAMLDAAQGYAIGITVLNGTTLNHHLLMKNFPLLDLLKSWNKVKGLMVEKLGEEPLAEF